MDNFIKALSISALMSGSFMTQAMDTMDDLEAEAKIWGFSSVAEYLDQMGRENEFSKPQPQPPVFQDKGMEASLRLAQDLQAQDDKMARLASTKQDPYEKARQLHQDHELAQRMSHSWGPMAHAPIGGDPDLDSTLKLVALYSSSLDSQYANTHNDHLLAHALEEEVDPRGAYNLPFLKKKVTEGDKIAYETIVAAAKTIKIDSDVHTMTQSFARPHYAKTKRLEQTYIGILQQPNKLLTLAEMKTDLDELAKGNDAITRIMPAINTVFGLIAGYWNAPIDAETGLDVREVMSNCFILARLYGPGALANLAIILADNTQTGGGCHPGVTGRLAHTFFTEVNAAIALG